MPLGCVQRHTWSTNHQRSYRRFKLINEPHTLPIRTLVLSASETRCQNTQPSGPQKSSGDWFAPNIDLKPRHFGMVASATGWFENGPLMFVDVPLNPWHPLTLAMGGPWPTSGPPGSLRSVDLGQARDPGLALHALGTRTLGLRLLFVTWARSRLPVRSWTCCFQTHTHTYNIYIWGFQWFSDTFGTKLFSSGSNMPCRW
jgi:hypothetical protein